MRQNDHFVFTLIVARNWSLGGADWGRKSRKSRPKAESGGGVLEARAANS